MLNVLPQTVAATLSLPSPTAAAGLGLRRKGKHLSGEGREERRRSPDPPLPSLPLPLPMMKTRKEREGELLYSAVNVIWERVCEGGRMRGRREGEKRERGIRARKNGVEKKKMLLFLGI